MVVLVKLSGRLGVYVEGFGSAAWSVFFDFL
jgi:hypothetical protein